MINHNPEIILKKNPYGYGSAIKELITVNKIPEERARSIIASDIIKQRKDIGGRRILRSLRNALQEEKEKSYVDHLTGFYNRRYFLGTEKVITGELERQYYNSTIRENNGTLTLLMVDLDRFKRVNDTYGHMIGDQLLRVFAKAVKDTIRKSDIPVRYGGEEFCILFPRTDAEKTLEIIERIRKHYIELQNTDALLKEKGVLIQTISAGLSSLANEPKSHVELLELADKALYVAKQTGRNKVIISEQNLNFKR